MTSPNQTRAWQALKTHYETMSQVHMRDLFNKDIHRFEKFSLKSQHILLDYSKNIITEETLANLFNLARETRLQDAIADMFSGVKINLTENRAVLHTALRNRSNRPIVVDGEDVMPDVNAVLAQMKIFSDDVRMGGEIGEAGETL